MCRSFQLRGRKAAGESRGRKKRRWRRRRASGSHIPACEKRQDPLLGISITAAANATGKREHGETCSATAAAVAAAAAATKSAIAARRSAKQVVEGCRCRSASANRVVLPSSSSPVRHTVISRKVTFARRRHPRLAVKLIRDVVPSAVRCCSSSTTRYATVREEPV